MPRYTYECTKCGHSWELLEGWEASRRKRCPDCRSRAQRIPRAPAIVFKGKGFYATDNRSSKFEKRRQEEEGGGSAEGSSGDGSSSDGSSSDGAAADAPSSGRGSGKKSGAGSKKAAKAEK